MNKFCALIIIILLSSGQARLLSASFAKTDDSHRKLVLTSIYPVYVLAKNLSGELYNVENLLSSGSSPHDYQFKPNDIKKIQQADLILLNGLGIDDWFIDAKNRLFPNKNVNCKIISKGLEKYLIPLPDARSTDASNSKTYNPHFWLDPILMICASSNVAEFLIELNPSNRSIVQKNLEVFVRKMTALDKKIFEELSPFKERSIIVKHNAFDYFAKRYNLKILGVIEETHELPSSPQHIANLIKLAKEHRPVAVFGEPDSSNEIAKRIAEELNIPFAILDPVETGELTTDEYVKKMLNNVNVLKKLLR